MTRCFKHAQARAAWRCSACQRALCPYCAAGVESQGETVVRCISCNGLADRIMTRRSITPFWQMTPHFLRAFFSFRGLPILVVGAALLVVLGWLHPALSAGVLAAYYFLVVRHTALGAELLPSGADLGHAWSDMLVPLGRFVLVTALLWIPAATYLLMRYEGLKLLGAPLDLVGDPVIIALTLLGVLYVPGALIMATLRDSTSRALNPVQLISIVRLLPKQYLLLTGQCLALMVMALGIAIASVQLVGRVSMPVVLPLVALFLLEIPVVLTAQLVGWFVYQNGEELGLSGPGRCQEAEYPEAEPLGKLAARGESAPPWESGERRLSLPRDFADDGDPSLPQNWPDTTTDVQVLLDVGDKRGALGAYRQLLEAGEDPDLDPEREMQLAELLEQDEDFHLAMQTYHRIGKHHREHPLAPRALLRAATLLADRLDFPDKARDLCHYIEKHFRKSSLRAEAKALCRRLEEGS